MLMAVIGDIHGNLPALQAVLEPIDAAGIQTILCTGDSVVGYPWPNEVVDLLRERGIPSVQGEMDRLAGAFLRKGRSLEEKWLPAHFAALRWTYENMTSLNIEFLRELPRQRTVTLEGIDVFLCHGSPGGGPGDGLREDQDDQHFLRQREAANAPIVACGRTHRPFHRWALDTLFVNPGSVGIPPDEGPRASCALVNTETEPWTAEIQWVEYDFEPVLRRLHDLGLERP